MDHYDEICRLLDAQIQAAHHNDRPLLCHEAKALEALMRAKVLALKAEKLEAQLP